MINRTAAAAATIALLASCGKDNSEQSYPAVMAEFATIQSGISGNVEKLVDDANRTFVVNADYSGTRLNGEGAYRVVATYQPLSMPTANSYGTADIYALLGVFCEPTVPLSSMASHFESDPVTVAKIWKRGGFVNMELDIMAKDSIHDFKYALDGNEGGTNNAMVKLHHNAHNDYPAYTKTAYLSLQLAEFERRGNDSVAIYINGNNGWQRFCFPVK